MAKYRSSSQVSVYNYPEHLNPFYEDEQHKRLRFWKIKTSSKSNENKNNGLRRGSFNLGSLRDLFPLKSFRMKKRSSALGINVTSESPPPLRRDIIGYNKEDEDRYAAHDPHFRYTVDNNFARNAAYRSSLQNMSTTANNDFLTFNRNNRYRNTIQNGSAAKNSRYVYSGSMTPTPKSRYLTDVTPRMTPGSSMNSVSTNPFEDDEDEEIEEHMEMATSNNLEVTKVEKITKRRKKRRAPPPPPSQQQMLGANSTEMENVELRTAGERDGLEELSRMTREFENFVKHTNDSEEPRILLNGEEMEENEKVLPIETKEEEEEMNSIIVEVNEKPIPIPLEIKKTEIKASEVKIVELEAPQAAFSEFKMIELKEPNHVEAVEEKKDQVVITTTLSSPCQNEIPKEKEENPQIVIDEERLKINEHDDDELPLPSIEVITSEVQQLLTEIRSYPEFQRLTPTPTPSREETPDFIPLTVREKFHVKLRIEEDENAINNNKNNNHDIIEEVKTSKKEEEEIKKEIVPQSPTSQLSLKPIRDTTPIPLARTEVEEKLSSQGFRKVTKTEFLKFDEIENVEIRKKNPDEDKLIIQEENGDEPPKPPERRRSVKEIIESINKQQQKLKINQPPSTPQFERKFYYGEPQKFSYHEKPAVPSKENVLLKLKRQEEHERRINELLDDLQGFSHDRTSLKLERDGNNNSSVNPIPKPRRAV